MSSSFELLLAYANTKDIATRNTIVKLNLNLARKVAHKAKSMCHEPYEDLEQEATLGLIKAVERFNPNLGNAFSSFAVPFIYGKILQYLRDKGHLIRLSQSIQSLNLRGKKVSESLRLSLGRTPTLQEVADSLQVAVEDYKFALEANNLTKDFTPIDIESENLIGSNTIVIESESTLNFNLDYSILKPTEVATLGKKNSSKRSLWKTLATSLNK